MVEVEELVLLSDNEIGEVRKGDNRWNARLLKK